MATYKPILGKISKTSDNEVEWTIQNFSSYTMEDEYYYSPKFIISNKKWRMGIYPNGEISENSTGWISLHLHRSNDVDDEEDTISANYSFGVKKEDGKFERIRPECIWLFDNETGYGYNLFLQRSELQQRKSELLPSDTLTLTCNLRAANDIESYTRQNTARDFLDFYISKTSYDATLKVKDKEFHVHKLILSSRSPVFASVFEKSRDVVDIPDCDPNAFREFFLYLYSGKLEKVPSNTIELYKIANKYAVEDLKSYCRMSILTNLTVENFFDAVEFGRLFSLSEIKLKTQKFFNQNFQEISKTDKWSTFTKEKPSVAIELLEANVRVLGKWK